MNRRTLLGLAGGVASGFGGCLATGAGDTTPDSTATMPPATPSGTPPANTGGLSEFDPAATYNQVDVGTRDGVPEKYGPHDLVVWNAVERETRISLRVLDRVAETTVHRDEYDLPTDQAVSVTLLSPSRYFVQLWGPAIEPPETLRVPCSFFDCNSSVTRIGVFDGGAVRSSVMSTDAGCPSPDC